MRTAPTNNLKTSKPPLFFIPFLIIILLTSSFTAQGMFRTSLPKLFLTKKLSATTPQKQAETITGQTEAHLSTLFGTEAVASKNYLQKLEKYYKKSSIEKVTPLIGEIIAKENALKHNYYAFYHGQRKQNKLLQDIITGYIESVTGRELQDFVYVRPPDNNALERESLDFFLARTLRLDYKGEPCAHAHDRDEESKKNLISVTPALFSGSELENSFTYFLHNTNASAPFTLTEKLLCLRDNIFLKYTQELEQLSQLIDTTEGNLLQICIPKKSVTAHAYLSLPLGIPCNNHEVSTCCTMPQPRYNTTDIFLEHYQKNIQSLLYCQHCLHQIQARLVVPSGLLNPDSGIKIYQYSTETPTVKAAYQQQLKELIKKIIAEKK